MVLIIDAYRQQRDEKVVQCCILQTTLSGLGERCASSVCDHLLRFFLATFFISFPSARSRWDTYHIIGVFGQQLLSCCCTTRTRHLVCDRRQTLLGRRHGWQLLIPGSKCVEGLREAEKQRLLITYDARENNRGFSATLMNSAKPSRVMHGLLTMTGA